MTLSQTEVEILFPSPLIDIPCILQENLKNRNEICLRNSLIEEGRYADCVDEIIIKIARVKFR